MAVIAGVDQVAATVARCVAEAALAHIALGGRIAAHALHTCQGPPFALVLLADICAELQGYLLRDIGFGLVHLILPFNDPQDQFDSQL